MTEEEEQDQIDRATYKLAKRHSPGHGLRMLNQATRDYIRREYEKALERALYEGLPELELDKPSVPT